MTMAARLDPSPVQCWIESKWGEAIELTKEPNNKKVQDRL